MRNICLITLVVVVGVSCASLSTAPVPRRMVETTSLEDSREARVQISTLNEEGLEMPHGVPRGCTPRVRNQYPIGEPDPCLRAAHFSNVRRLNLVEEAKDEDLHLP